jgi:hypothetical protein
MLNAGTRGNNAAVTNDAKIHDIAVAYIRKAVEERVEWRYTTVGVLHPSLVGCLSLADGELVLVSAFFSSESWYTFTTRRIVSKFQGTFQSLDPSHGIEDDFGNFKGYAPGEDGGRVPGAVPREVATIKTTDSHAVVRFEFTTWNESMLPIQAARFWQVKHPFLHKLMTSAERENYRARNG